MKQYSFLFSISFRRIFNRVSLGAGLCLVMAQMAMAQLYVNTAESYYSINGSGTPPPNINATAFDNENVFSVSYSILSYNQMLLSEPWFGTLFFTNNGTMTV